MREDGDIDKEYFRERKKEIEGKINRLAESIKNLTPIPAKDIAGDYSERLSELKKKLGEYTDFDGLVIPESIVEAFIQKIWVSKDEFRWYLRTNRSGSAEEAEHIQIGSFTLTLEDAKANGLIHAVLRLLNTFTFAALYSIFSSIMLQFSLRY